MRDIRGGALDVIGGMRVLFGVCGTDHLPEIGPAGLPFLASPPPNPKEQGIGTENDQQGEKKECLFLI